MKLCWVESDIRESVIKYVEGISEKTDYTNEKILEMIGISRSKYYEWLSRRGIPNRHNQNVPRKNWTTPEERKSIVRYVSTHYSNSSNYARDGYRRLTYEMIDLGIACVCPSTVYRILKSEGLLNRWSTRKTSSKGNGYIQPVRPHQEWHTDIKYVEFRGINLFFIGVLDGYSRYIIHFELRLNMSEYDVELSVQRAKEKNPKENPRIITDNGPQYTSKEFQQFLKEVEFKHIRTSVGYPQSNGKIERFHRSLGEECLKTKSMISIEDAREVIGKYVEYYNTKRLHSALFYLTPEDYLLGRVDSRLKERELKIKNASIARKEYWSKKIVV